MWRRKQKFKSKQRFKKEREAYYGLNALVKRPRFQHERFTVQIRS